MSHWTNSYEIHHHIHSHLDQIRTIPLLILQQKSANLNSQQNIRKIHHSSLFDQKDVPVIVPVNLVREEKLFELQIVNHQCNLHAVNTGCIKKTEQILNRSQRREAAQSMKFLINIDCLGTYDVE